MRIKCVRNESIRSGVHIVRDLPDMRGLEKMIQEVKPANNAQTENPCKRTKEKGARVPSSCRKRPVSILSPFSVVSFAFVQLQITPGDGGRPSRDCRPWIKGPPDVEPPKRRAKSIEPK